MKVVLVTGISGFVGRHLLEYFFQNEECVYIVGLDIKAPAFPIEKESLNNRFEFIKVDLNDYDSVRCVISEKQPEVIIHLASFSSVASSWKYPIKTFRNNTDVFLNLVTAIWSLGISPRILSVGSSEEYGNIYCGNNKRIAESAPLKPTSPYGIARVSQEMLSQLFADKYGLDIVMTRSFNHIGLWQDTRFAIPSFIEHIMEQKNKGMGVCMLDTGDVSVIRDYIDIRDVIDAYILLIKKGVRGEAYNICSGEGISLDSAIKIIGEVVGVEVKIRRCETKIRPAENACLIGDPGKMELLGWKRKYSFRDSIESIVSNWM